MVKKQQDLKPDTILKNYWNNNEQFADFFNAVLFEGEQVIKPDELEDVDTEESTIVEHREYAESIKASRDTIKVQKKSSAWGVQFVMLGMEGQEHIHYAMPMRVMGYDYGTYKKQYDSNAKQYKLADGLEEDEYLSRMKRTDKFVPVITVVVYYGEKTWDGAVSLHGMLNIPEKMRRYVNDYKMLLIEARQNNLRLHNMENRDFFNLLQIFLDKSISTNEAREKAIQYCEEHKTSKSVIVTVAGATNSQIDYSAFEKGDGKMCTLVQEIAKEGEEKGKLEGEIKGIIKILKKYNESNDHIIDELVSEFSISKGEAVEYLDKYNNGNL